MTIPDEHAEFPPPRARVPDAMPRVATDENRAETSRRHGDKKRVSAPFEVAGNRNGRRRARPPRLRSEAEISSRSQTLRYDIVRLRLRSPFLGLFLSSCISLTTSRQHGRQAQNSPRNTTLMVVFRGVCLAVKPDQLPAFVPQSNSEVTPDGAPPVSGSTTRK
jgi:hypothetical protein